MDGTLLNKKYRLEERVTALEEGGGGGGGSEWSTTEHEVGTWIDGTPVYEKTVAVTLGGAGDTDRLLVSGLAPTRAWIADSDFVYNTGAEQLHFYLGVRVNGVWTTGFLINKSDGLYVRLNNNYAGVEGVSGYVTIRYVKPVASTRKRSSKKTEK